MPFGTIGWTGPGMRQVVGFGDRFMGMGTLGGKFGVHHCNQWGVYGIHVRQCLNRGSCGLWWCVRWACIRWAPTLCKGKGRFWGFLFSIFTMGNAIVSPTVKCFRFVCKNLTTFPFGKHIIGKLDSWHFWRYIQIKLGVYEKKIILKTDHQLTLQCKDRVFYHT